MKKSGAASGLEDGRGFQPKGGNATRTVKKAVVKMEKAEAKVPRKHHGEGNGTGAGGDERQRKACGLGRLSTVKGLEQINDAAVWSETSRTTLYRVAGEFWMSEERSLGEPEKKVFHWLAQVSDRQARKFLSKHSKVVEMGEAESRIGELDQKDGVGR